MNYVLNTNFLSKEYKNQIAVNQVNMNIGTGSIYGFIGENGAGKTTIIRLITGLIHASSGSFELFGVDNNDIKISEARRRVSAVVETPSLYLHLNAYDNLLVQCKILGITDYSIVEEILNIVGLNYLKTDKKKVKNFSLGMKQRLGLAIALIGNPDFIILDEPMNGLDPEGIIEIRELIMKLNKEKNITFLISSHILSELSKIATDYGFIHRGKLIKEISAEELARECKKCLEIKVSDVTNITKVFDSILKIQDYKILDSNIVRIYEEIDITKLITSLADEKINVVNMLNKDENIEEYYLNIMGGKHA